jgi:hypothetical protein
MSEKTKLYAFIFGPLMQAAVDGFTRCGWEGVDKVTARYMLEAQLCKYEVYNAKTKSVEVCTESISHMNNKQLLKFATDAMMFLETELNQKTPDSEEWFMKLKSGKNYKRII